MLLKDKQKDKETDGGDNITSAVDGGKGLLTSCLHAIMDKDHMIECCYMGRPRPLITIIQLGMLIISPSRRRKN